LYQSSHEHNNFPTQEFRPPLKSNRYNLAGREQYPISQNGQSQPNNQTWPRAAAFAPQQTGRGRYPFNPQPGSGYSNLSGPPQQQFQPSQPPPSHPSRRPNPSSRPQVRLPSTGVQTPPKADTKNPTYGLPQTPSRSPGVKARSNSQQLNKDFNAKPVPNSFRRHRHSTSGSSKASTGSNPWSQVTPTKTLTQPSSPDSSSQPISSETSNPLPLLEDLQIQEDEDDEWLLLRTEAFQKPRPEIQRDKYSHLHPVVRKWASQTIPELKMGEPRWANAVMSRRWQKEETLEQDKKAYHEKGRTSPVHTCMTEKEAEAYALAQETLALIRKFDMDAEEEK